MQHRRQGSSQPSVCFIQPATPPTGAFWRRIVRTRGALLAALACALVLVSCATNKEAEAPFDPESLGVSERVRHYQEAIRTAPEDPESHYRLGNALLDMGRFQDAYYAYQRAVQLKPDFANAYANLGLALRRAGNLKAAAGAYAQALELNPQDATTLNNLLVVAELQEDWDRVAWCVERLAALEPDDPKLMTAHADVLCQMGRHGEAAPRYEKAAESLEPARNYYRAGVCYFDLGRWADAAAAWERARSLEPENASVNRGLAVAYWEGGDIPAALAVVKRCEKLGITLDPALVNQIETGRGG